MIVHLTGEHFSIILFENEYQFERCEVLGKYNTKQRQMILDCFLARSEEHLTADLIIKILNESGAKIGRATVYRNLDLLFKDGTIRRYSQSDGSPACYQLIDSDKNCHEHFHLLCDSCGEVTHLDCGHIHNLTSHISDEHNFMIDDSKTVLYGTCKKCQHCDASNNKNSI